MSAKTRKRWVKELLGEKKRLETAIGVPVGEMLGCGAFGCAFESAGPWVVKLTTDTTEAQMWEYIINLIREEDRGQAGFTRVKDVFRLRPGVGKGGKRAAYAIIREAIAPVFRSKPPYEVTTTTYEKLGLDPDRDGPVTHDMVIFKQPDLADLRRELVEERQVHPARAEQVAQNVQSFWTNMALLDRYRTSELDFRGKRIGNQRLRDIAQNVAYRMSGWIGAGIGEGLELLLDNGTVLRDAHALNIGWRIHESIAGWGVEVAGLVLFDPGYTPTPYRPKIEERQLRNPAAPHWVV